MRRSIRRRKCAGRFNGDGVAWPDSRIITVMPGFMPGIHVFLLAEKKDVDGRDKPGHDDITHVPLHSTNG